MGPNVPIVFTSSSVVATTGGINAAQMKTANLTAVGD
jgi:hypothetical protein